MTKRSSEVRDDGNNDNAKRARTTTTTVLPTFCWQKTISFLRRKDIGNLALTSSKHREYVCISSCTDKVVVTPSDLLKTTMHFTDCHLHNVSNLSSLQDAHTHATKACIVITSIAFGREFDQQIDAGVLPPSLFSLKFGRFFNQLLMPGVLPQSLTSLVFGTEFDQFIGQGVLPPSLTFLKFGHCFQQPFLHEVYPPSLKSINYCPCKPTVFL